MHYEEAEYIKIPHGCNLAIGVSGKGHRGSFSCLITDTLPDMGVIECGQWFPFFLYEVINVPDLLVDAL